LQRLKSRQDKRVLFLSKTFGDAFEFDLAGRALRLLTGHYPHHGYTRALYLANGGVLLSGPERFDPRGPSPSRVQCFLYVLDRSLTKPSVALGTKCSEGPAVSRRRLHIAWTHVSAQCPDRLPRGASQMHEADVVSEKGAPRLAGARLAPDGIDRPVQGLPPLALPAVEKLALHRRPPGEPGRADAQEPEGEPVAADAAVQDGQFQLLAQLAGKTVVGVLSGGNLDLRELARTRAGAGD
jgi:hypothetical protein